jgi:glycosyltransferase involved in cell wall biosynthesis
MSFKRNIALFSTSFLPYSQTFIYDEIRAHSDNYEITVFCKDRQNEERFPFDQYHKPNGKLAEMVYQNIAYWPSFNKIIGNGDFDLIHAHFGTGAVYALPYVKKYNIPFVVTFHGNDVAALMGVQKYKTKRWRYYAKHKQIFKYSSLLLAASEELKSLLIELGADPSKVKVYHLGIDLSKFDYQEPVPQQLTNLL